MNLLPHDDDLFNLHSKTYVGIVRGPERAQILAPPVSRNAMPMVRPDPRPTMLYGRGRNTRKHRTGIPVGQSRTATYRIPAGKLRPGETYDIQARLRSCRRGWGHSSNWGVESTKSASCPRASRCLPAPSGNRRSGRTARPVSRDSPPTGTAEPFPAAIRRRSWRGWTCSRTFSLPVRNGFMRTSAPWTREEDSPGGSCRRRNPAPPSTSTSTLINQTVDRARGINVRPNGQPKDYDGGLVVAGYSTEINPRHDLFYANGFWASGDFGRLAKTDAPRTERTTTIRRPYESSRG